MERRRYAFGQAPSGNVQSWFADGQTTKESWRTLVSKALGQDASIWARVLGQSKQFFGKRMRSVTAGRGSPHVHNGAKRRWAINGDFISLRRNGVARYAREVTLQLDKLISEGHPLARDLELTLIAPREPNEDLKSIRTRIVTEYRHPRLPQVWVQMQLPFYVKGGLLSFCNLAPVVCKRHVVCIHDLHTKFMPESYGWLFRLAHNAILPLLGRRAARITTVSELSKEHLATFGVAPNSKIVVTYNGADHARRWDGTRSQLDTGTSRPYVVCLGRSEKYKNTKLIERLAPSLDRLGLDLWVVGDPSPTAFGGEAVVGRSNVRKLGRISDDDFAKVLSEAVCFLFPSRIEGFGLPAVEAMIQRCPVVASTAPCLPEICGDAALYADPDDDDAWLSAIERLRNDAALRSQLVERGCARAERYSWRAIAEQYLTLMAEIDGLVQTAGNREQD